MRLLEMPAEHLNPASACNNKGQELSRVVANVASVVAGNAVSEGEVIKSASECSKI